MLIGVASFNGQIQGYVSLTQHSNYATVECHLTSGLKRNQRYAIHIHEAGDLRDAGCVGACAHYNPFNQTHGGRDTTQRHVGDLGNITGNRLGGCTEKFNITGLKLRGRYGVIGRSIVIHEHEDDLGLGQTPESLTTGSAGRRIGCGVIGYAKNSKLHF